MVKFGRGLSLRESPPSGSSIGNQDMQDKDFQRFEELVADIQSHLSPESEVVHNHRIKGVLSGTFRQVDVFVRGFIGQYEMTIAIECKDYKRKIDVKKVEEFAGMVEDIGCHRGVLVSALGFSQAAKERARRLGIELYRPVDTRDHKWKTSISAHAVFEFYELAISYKFSCSSPLPMTLSSDFFANTDIFDEIGTPLGTAVEKIVHDWNAEIMHVEAGEHFDVPIFSTTEVYCDNGYGTRMPIDRTADLYVAKQLFLGDLEIRRISGFQDQIKGGVITRAFEIGLLTPQEIIERWTPIKDEEELQLRPLLKISGRTMFDLAETKRRSFLFA